MPKYCRDCKEYNKGLSHCRESYIVGKGWEHSRGMNRNNDCPFHQLSFCKRLKTALARGFRWVRGKIK
jgi:hypothetical protein